MLKKKLLTLACAVGILASGACFVPALIDDVHRPPPPPMSIDLHGIRRLDVTVTDTSTLKKVDTDKLADQIRFELNELSRDTKVKARDPKDRKPADASLKITVLDESATPSPEKDAFEQEFWIFRIRIAASLTTRDGQEIWHQSGQDYSYSRRMNKQDPAETWNRAGVSVFYQLPSQFVRSMFYGEIHDH
jgi:hypothetical protein